MKKLAFLIVAAAALTMTSCYDKVNNGNGEGEDTTVVDSTAEAPETDSTSADTTTADTAQALTGDSVK